MMVGQQAYLSSEVQSLEQDTSPSTTEVVTVTTVVKVRNLGNTPAYIDYSGSQFEIINKPTGIDVGVGPMAGDVSTLLPKDEIFMRSSVRVPRALFTCTDEECYIGKFSGSIGWHTVFDEHKVESWCSDVQKLNGVLQSQKCESLPTTIFKRN
jgi:hypothetical protein